MERLKCLIIYLLSWPRISVERAMRVIHAAHAPSVPVPVVLTTFWSARDSERSNQQAIPATSAPPRVIPVTQDSTRARVQKTLAGIALWFGLFFSAALIGTFIVIGLVLAYAFLMSATGH